MGGRRTGRRGFDMATRPGDGEGPSPAGPAARRAAPVAQVRVTIYGTDEGEAEVEVAIDPAGPFGAAHGEGDARIEAYERLYETVQRELGDALAVLGEGES